MHRRTLALLPVALLASAAGGCSSEPEAPGAITADEDRQLNEAAAMLDANSMSADALNDAARTGR